MIKTVSQIKQVFNETLKMTHYEFGAGKNEFILFCNKVDYTHLWYCCTSEQDDFKIYHSDLYYHGIKVKSI